jgi:hypothetical protein
MKTPPAPSQNPQPSASRPGKRHAHAGISRREFIGRTLAGAAILAGPANAAPSPPAPLPKREKGGNPLRADITALLRDWCDGLVKLQIDDPARPERHGALACPACADIHGRCGDAAYPLLAMAKLSGDPRYRNAAVRLVEWMKNVESPDGAWTNDLSPKSWKGITVFGAIALGQALQRYGDLLDRQTRDRWTARLRKAGQFIHANFKLGYSNANYTLTAPYALALLGRQFGEDSWRSRGKELAAEAGQFFTKPHGLVFGEATPIDKITPLGCRAVDLGYNVEGSLPALLSYATLENDVALRQRVVASLAAHLAFMLPDGGWDNSWGTRSFKWTYWGSRTADGCLGAYLSAAPGRPEFLTAARRHLELLRRSTHAGLLYGGPHLASRGVPACVHHTFCHAKSLADALQADIPAGEADEAPLPRQSANGLAFFPEIATWLVARGPWRATVTRYDLVYRPRIWHATGGALAVLWHAATGPLFVSSMAEYKRIEPNNMQKPPGGEDFPLTPRVEQIVDSERFSNLCDAAASVTAKEENGSMAFHVDAALCDTAGKAGSRRAQLDYVFLVDEVRISAQSRGDGPDARLILPLVSDLGETVRRVSEKCIAVQKPSATVLVQADAAIDLPADSSMRVFNLVPGFLAVPLSIGLPRDGRVQCTIRVLAAKAAAK